MRVSQQQGFSLLEVLVAFVILALSLGVLMQIFSTSVRGVMVSEQYSQAVMLAQSKLTEAVKEQALESGSSSGEFNDKYHWQVDLAPYESEEALPEVTGIKPFQVVASVRWQEAGRERVLTLHTLRLSKEKIIPGNGS